MKADSHRALKFNINPKLRPQPTVHNHKFKHHSFSKSTAFLSIQSLTSVMSTAPPPQSSPRQRRPQHRGRGAPRGGRANSNAQHPDLRSAVQPEIVPKTADTPDDDQMTVASSEVCIICASPVVYTAVSPCNHQTCHICSLRLRALYKSKACAHCRVSFNLSLVLCDANWPD
jgi:hypothetical protein